ncbi:MAG: hypothetical protein BJ554DRAFT_664 [Olpidium bornovanus]|uniref:Uncharacterized protein n=1 Tax=Olpidium bornovanus TaxID=278681 RepID=A0A8H8DMK3_9FUNG|nr:MAG: hypothetical protein BJ554DRAFT_664 [Olpidium bornovanus]
MLPKWPPCPLLSARLAPAAEPSKKATGVLAVNAALVPVRLEIPQSLADAGSLFARAGSTRAADRLLAQPAG